MLYQDWTDVAGTHHCEGHQWVSRVTLYDKLDAYHDLVDPGDLPFTRFCFCIFHLENIGTHAWAITSTPLLTYLMPYYLWGQENGKHRAYAGVLKGNFNPIWNHPAPGPFTGYIHYP
jgi:hypothetical protein